MLNNAPGSQQDDLSLPDDAPVRPPRQFTRANLALWLIAGAMVIFFLPLSFVSSAIRDDTKGYVNDLNAIRTSLTQVPTLIPEATRLVGAIGQYQAQSASYSRAVPTIQAGQLNLPGVMSAIGYYNPAELTISNLSRVDRRITLSGVAIRDDVVTNYVHALEQSGYFSRVTLQSIQLVATPVLTPTATVTPTMTLAPTATPTVFPTWTDIPSPTSTPAPSSTPVPSSTPLPTATATLTNTATATVTPTKAPTSTATPTVDLRDSYEPDDTQPKPISPGQTQTHSFFPSNDVDNVYFIAKSARCYRVTTSGLATGVDTTIAVQVGAFTYANDDASAGVLYSQVDFCNTAGDVNAVVGITNRGEFGSTKTYNVTVIETTLTPTVTRTPTITPTPSLTPVPTNTLVPTATRTPTPVPSSASQKSLAPTATKHAYSPQRVPGYTSGLLRPAAAPVFEMQMQQAGTSVRFVILLDLLGATP